MELRKLDYQSILKPVPGTCRNSTSAWHLLFLGVHAYILLCEYEKGVIYMRVIFSILGLLGVFVLVGFLEAQTVMDDRKSNHYILNDETESVSVTMEEPTLPSSTQYVLEETIEKNREIIETYREYEIYEDENGIVVKRVPTSNYNYLSYSTGEEDQVTEFEYND